MNWKVTALACLVLCATAEADTMYGEFRKYDIDNDGNMTAIIDLDGKYEGKALEVTCNLVNHVPDATCKPFTSATDVVIESDGSLYTRHGHLREDTILTVYPKNTPADKTHYYVISLK